MDHVFFSPHVFSRLQRLPSEERQAERRKAGKLRRGQWGEVVPVDADQGFSVRISLKV